MLGREPAPHEVSGFAADKIKTKREEWKTQDLIDLRNRMPKRHSHESPSKGDVAEIIVAKLGSAQWLLDGTNRINKWENEGVNEKHPVFILELI